MKKNLKTVALLICSACCFVSCEDDNEKDNEAKEGLYTLREAYDKGQLTQADLQAIADLYHNNKNCAEQLNEEVAITIRKAWLKDYIERKGESCDIKTEDDVMIYNYYGTYNKCVACYVERKGIVYTAVYAPYIITVGGVDFHFNNPGPTITIWKTA